MGEKMIIFCIKKNIPVSYIVRMQGKHGAPSVISLREMYNTCIENKIKIRDLAAEFYRHGIPTKEEIMAFSMKVKNNK